MGHAQNKKQFFFRNNKNQILSFQNLFILTKYRMFWLSYKCFSILCNAFFAKKSFPAITAVICQCIDIGQIFFSINVCVNFWYKSTVFNCGACSMGMLRPWFFKLVHKWVGNFFSKQSFTNKLFCNDIKSGSLRILRSL